MFGDSIWTTPMDHFKKCKHGNRNQIFLYLPKQSILDSTLE